MQNLIDQAKRHRRLLLTLIAIAIPAVIIVLALVRVGADDSVQTATTNWSLSGHADFTSQAFTNWHDDDPPLVPANCAACHSLHGLLDFVGERGNPAGSVAQDMPIGTVVSCNACHNNAVHALKTVTFPSGAVVNARGEEAACLLCHQGRASTISVENAISGLAADMVSEELAFISVHYHVAAATLMGTTARGGYEYAGQQYVGRFEHTQNFQTCNSCHDPHRLQIDTLTCSTCHVYVTEPQHLRDIRRDPNDYDGDGNTSKGIAHEIESFHTRLYNAIQRYADDVIGVPIIYYRETFPYFFTGIEGQTDLEALGFGDRYTEWTPRLLRAAYNYHFVHMDPGAYAHNPRYTMQILYDSLLDIDERIPAELEGLLRP